MIFVLTHRCICGAFVNESAVHELSCEKTAGRHFCHFNLNDIIELAFNSWPWFQGQILVWDATYCDTLGPLYVKKIGYGSIAKLVAVRKRYNYRDIINQNFSFSS